jgi:hypothetical protein
LYRMHAQEKARKPTDLQEFLCLSAHIICRK